MADKHFEPGSMEVAEQEKTFAGFMRWVTNSVIVILFILVFLAIFAR
ncbi:aa3-type cytochrome c oxidase subunit IV [Palleronia sp. KMU-117]